MANNRGTTLCISASGAPHRPRHALERRISNRTTYTMFYYKRKWNQSRGDEYDSWGTSTLFINTDESGIPLRQIKIYENGKRLKYDIQKPMDQYGMLGDQKLDVEEIEEYKISREAFETEWEVKMTTGKQ